LQSADRAIADLLEVDPEALDKRFDEWLGCVDCKSQADAGQVCRGLADALCGLWQAIGAPNSADGGPESAIKRLQDFHQDAIVLSETVECVLTEYLSRMHRKLQTWMECCDPAADDVAEVVTWLLVDALPALTQLEAAVTKLVVFSVSEWRHLTCATERLLLSEWEMRSCDEVSHACECVYSLPIGSVNTICNRNAHSSRKSALPNDAELAPARGETVLATLLGVIRQSRAWQDHPTACDRAVSVLIAALSASLRAHRDYVRWLLAPHVPLPEHHACKSSNSKSNSWRQGVKRRLRRASSRLLDVARRALKGLPCTGEPAVDLPCVEVLAEAADDAARLATFCREADVPFAATCIEVLASFADAFEREASEVCTVIAEVHFQSAHDFVLSRIAFKSRELLSKAAAEVPSPEGVAAASAAATGAHNTGVLDGALLDAARRFMDEAFGETSPLCQRFACDAVTCILVKRLSRAVCEARPRLFGSVPGVAAVVAGVVEADEAALRCFGASWGAEQHWREERLGPLLPLVGLIRRLRQPDQHDVDIPPAVLVAGAR
jgi:hypothetical protein